MAQRDHVLQAGGITSAQLQSEPVIHDDRRVTFTLKAPDAHTVQVVPMGDDNGMGAGPYDMVRGGEGVWTVTIGPVRPGFHYYLLRVDGADCLNPASEVYWGWARVTNGLDVPDPDLDFYSPKDVPHGEVRLHFHRSRITGALRRIVVYTPPGYDSEPADRYPVLYLQHGSGESERGWTWQGRANFILDNLLAEGRAVPMIVVMENGYAAAPGTPNPGQPPRGENLFERVVVEELVPHVDAAFRTIADREHRAIAGLSMGGGQSLDYGLGNLDTFAYVGGFSSAPNTRSVDLLFPDPEKAKKMLKVL